MRRVATLLALAAIAIGATGADAATREWIAAHDVVASPDGRHVYASGGQTFSFRVLDGGALELIGQSEPGATNSQIAISPDGRFVYVGRGQAFPTGAIVVMSRDPDTGLLTHEETFSGDGKPGNSAIGSVSDLEMSVDGRQLYVSERNPELLAVYGRDPDTGALTQRQALYAGPELPVPFTADLASSPDGRNVYLAGDSILNLRRDPATGLLTAVDTARDNATDFSVAVAPDGRRVYGGGGGKVDTWTRDPDTGSLTHLQHAALADPSCLCDNGPLLSAAPDGRALFAAFPPDPVLVQAQTTDQGLAVQRRYVQGEDGMTGLNHPNAMAWSPDGQFAYVTSAEGSRNSTLASFRRTADGLALVGVAGPQFESPFGEARFDRAAITINDGAIYTNDPTVAVTIMNPRYFSSLRLSNTTDFSGARAMRIVGEEQTYAWRLETTGPERSVKRVHVRFTPHDGTVTQLFDDIILDERPPEVLAARIDGSRLKLRARDNRSGVKRLQVTASRKKPGKARRFKSSVPVSRKSRTLHVRVYDGAGNKSRWQIARRP